MPFMVPVFGSHTLGTKTATLNTALIATIPPMANAFTCLSAFSYTAGNTAHTVTVMRPLGSALIATSVAAAGTNCVLASNPGTYTNKSTSNNVIATGDWFVIQLDDGTFYTPVAAAATSTASNTSVSSLTLTTAAFPYAASAGNKVWWFGAATDTNPADNQAHPQFAHAANTTVVHGGGPSATNTIAMPSGIAGLVTSFGRFEPLMLHSNNATNAGTFDFIQAVYTDRGGPFTSNA